MKNKHIKFKAKPANILIYDDENITYYQGTWTSIEQSFPNYIESSYISDYTPRIIPMNYDIHITSNDLEQLDNIKLDETIMKRIAKYNKQKECQRLDKEIKQKEEKIKELDDLLQDKEKRWNKVKDYIKNIYEISLDEDYDDEDWEEE